MRTWTSSLTAALLFYGVVAHAQQQLSYTVVAEYPHDRQAFTQGLVFSNGKLYESTGLYGRSEIREVELETGRVLRKQALSRKEFGEGLAAVDDTLLQLTWTNGYAYRWHRGDFSQREKIPYRFAQNEGAKKGWGLCFNQRHLVFSDGSDQLHFLSPENFTPVRAISVFDEAGPVERLNELECIGDKVYANVWLTDHIVIINPGSGKVEARINLANLYPRRQRKGRDDLLNGIAWDEAGRRLFVTGKRWPRLYQIDINLQLR